MKDTPFSPAAPRSGTPKHFHPVYSLKFIQKYLIVYLLPLLRAALAWDWPALFAAVREELILFCAMALFAAAQWGASRWHLSFPESAPGAAPVLHIRSGLLLRSHRLVRAESLAALRLERPILFRLAGASALTLYFSAAGSPGSLTLYLSARDARALADALMPVPGGEVYRPVKGGRLAFALMSANLTATLLFAWVALRQSDAIGRWAEQQALTQLGRVAQLAGRWLPAGLAWLFTALCALATVSLLRGFFHTVRYRVCKVGNILQSEGGLWHFSQCRVRSDRLLYCDVRATPMARLLRRWPVYLAAGTWANAEIPVLVYAPGQEALLQTLLPGLRLPPKNTAPLAGRSVIAFVLPSGLAAGSLLLLTLVSRSVLPGLTATLLFPLALSLFWLALSLDGFRKEGAWRTDGRLTARHIARLTLHSYCFFAEPVRFSVLQNPWSLQAHRCNLTLHFSGGQAVTLRSLRETDADAVLPNPQNSAL